MSTELATVNNHLVARSSTKPWRWYDAFGPGVTKWFLDPYTFALATNATITNYTYTVATSGPMTMVAGADGGALVITAGAGDNQGAQFQPVTEGFYFAQPWPCYYGCKVALNDADQTDFLMGLTISDSTAVTAVSDGIYFWSVDETALVNFAAISTAAGVASTVAAHTLVDDAAVTLEWYFDGVNVTGYVNGVAVGSIAYSSMSFPKAEYMTPMVAFLTGEATANTLTISWARAIQIREA
jgi:hypothetical protein